jgi:2-aminoethylphosphonate-pyruvate transaminase
VILLTPGPLTTSAATRQAMLRDWGSWDRAFNGITASICADLVEVVNGAATHVCVPMQGSGTFSVEAALGTLVPRDARVLVPDNGAYCARIATILRYLGRDCVRLPLGEDRAARAMLLEDAFERDPAITHVAQVHCETSAGLLNPLEEIAGACERHGKGLVVDAMSSFGAIDIDLGKLRSIDAVVAASGKCIEGPPGMGFVIARQSLLERSKGNAHSLALDLHDQWTYMLETTRWRYTPPTHVVAAFRTALDQFHAEGGVAVRGERYRANCDALVAGMSALGLRTFLPHTLQAPIIVTFHAPRDAAYSFERLYEGARSRGFILYPGKLTNAETFRVGCIGAIGVEEIREAVTAIGATLHEMGVVCADTALTAD